MAPLLNKVTACGTVTVGSWPNEKVSEDTALQVSFKEAFDVVPSVLVQLAALDAASPSHKRIETWASDITCDGFRLHVRTWADSVTWMVKVSWIASSNPAQVQIGTCSAKDVKSRIDTSGTDPAPVKFPRPFACTPDVSLGWSGLDASGDANLCLLAGANSVGCRGFDLDCTSWCPDAIAWSTTMSWIACSSPASLQLGSQAFGTGPGGMTEQPIKSGSDRCVDIVFPKAFDGAPSVALALVGTESAQNTPLRLDTWSSNVTSRGFRMHLRCWGNSVTLFAKVAWVATPTTLDFTVEPIASHSPPSQYVAQGPALGQGAMGVTHRAKHMLDGQIYAVKTSKHPFSHHEESLRRELANLSKLPRHSNLLRYYTSVIEADRLHIVTECLDAFNFAELLPMPDGLFASRHHPNAVLTWIAQVFDGLAHMHAVGMTHRDLHSENVLVLRDSIDKQRPSQGPDAVRIIDFGVGKVADVAGGLCLMSQPAGFWQYASPERRNGHEFDDRDDVWAAGCHLLELSTGIPIRRRNGCGPDGNDFALSPSDVQDAIQECGSSSCRSVAQYVMVLERQSRPSAGAAHRFAQMALRPATTSCEMMSVDRQNSATSRKRVGSASGGARRTRPCHASFRRK